MKIREVFCASLPVQHQLHPAMPRTRVAATTGVTPPAPSKVEEAAKAAKHRRRRRAASECRQSKLRELIKLGTGSERVSSAALAVVGRTISAVFRKVADRSLDCANYNDEAKRVMPRHVDAAIGALSATCAYGLETL